MLENSATFLVFEFCNTVNSESMHCNAHYIKSIVAVTLQYVYLFCIIEIFQHNTHRLIYFEGLET